MQRAHLGTQVWNCLCLTLLILTRLWYFRKLSHTISVSIWTLCCHMFLVLLVWSGLLMDLLGCLEWHGATLQWIVCAGERKIDRWKEDRNFNLANAPLDNILVFITHFLPEVALHERSISLSKHTVSCVTGLLIFHSGASQYDEPCQLLSIPNSSGTAPTSMIYSMAIIDYCY